MVHSLPVVPPLDSAVSIELPLTLLWNTFTHFYGSFDVLLGTREAIEQIGTIEGVRGRLFIYDDCCYFGIPNIYRRAGQFAVLFQFDMRSLHFEPSKRESVHTLLFRLSDAEFCVMYE